MYLCAPSAIHKPGICSTSNECLLNFIENIVSSKRGVVVYPFMAGLISLSTVVKVESTWQGPIIFSSFPDFYLLDASGHPQL